MYVSCSHSLNEDDERNVSFRSALICQLELIDQSIFCTMFFFFLVFHFFSPIRCFISLRASESSRNDCLCATAHTNLILS
jgi:hypothetical protein